MLFRSRNASNAELLRIQVRGYQFILADDASSMGGESNHDGERPCTTCRCKTDKDLSIPLAVIGQEASSPAARIDSDSNRTSESLGLTEYLFVDRSVLDEPMLGSLDRPPKQVRS